MFAQMDWQGWAQAWAVVISAVGIVAVNIMTAWRQSTKSATIENKVDAVHEVVNSRDTALRDELRMLKEEVARLRSEASHSEGVEAGKVQGRHDAAKRDKIKENMD